MFPWTFFQGKNLIQIRFNQIDLITLFNHASHGNDGRYVNYSFMVIMTTMGGLFKFVLFNFPFLFLLLISIVNCLDQFLLIAQMTHLVTRKCFSEMLIKQQIFKQSLFVMVTP